MFVHVQRLFTFSTISTTPPFSFYPFFTYIQVYIYMIVHVHVVNAHTVHVHVHVYNICVYTCTCTCTCTTHVITGVKQCTLYIRHRTSGEGNVIRSCTAAWLHVISVHSVHYCNIPFNRNELFPTFFCFSRHYECVTSFASTVHEYTAT